ncbi:pirin family protein [Syntrophus sp. (in: bacteria)]|uniref:pirin family protein n=1 Tax=Syntrophus sp. (in: bacteria) TaxID=48412 RepID=UPI00345E5BFA
MTISRKIRKVFQEQAHYSGGGRSSDAGFRASKFPFDPFRSWSRLHVTIPTIISAGFPWHPHRGIETITYVLTGAVEHGDSMGNLRERISSGDVQWMTAGSGIIHQEMPKGDPNGVLGGFPALGEFRPPTR